MGHVTFVHGIGNKPEREPLRRDWLRALRVNDGVDLEGEGVTSSMVHWADLMYPAPAAPGSGNEATVEELEQTIEEPAADLGWLAEVPERERLFVEQVGEELGMRLVDLEHEETDVLVPGQGYELLPPVLARQVMRTFLRDVHHYLYDAEFSPGAGRPRVRIRRTVRDRMLDGLRDGAAAEGPHVVVGHSLGSVIAYDVLTGPGAPEVDALLTLGSPLGLPEVQHRLTPPWTRRDGFPATVSGGWTNAFDPLDPVCGGWERRLAGDYLRGGERRVDEHKVGNSGTWRHSVGKYLGQDTVREVFRRAFA